MYSIIQYCKSYDGGDAHCEDLDDCDIELFES